jgi:hypothetical protein
MRLPCFGPVPDSIFEDRAQILILRDLAVKTIDKLLDGFFCYLIIFHVFPQTASAPAKPR